MPIPQINSPNAQLNSNARSYYPWSQYIVQPTTYHLVVVVVIATTVEVSRLLQAGQQSGLPLGVVPHNSGAARATRARVASCNDDVVTVGHLDTTSYAAMK